MEDFCSKYERCLIATIFEHAKKKFKSQIQFAREVWPGYQDANVNTKIRAIRKKNSRGKPQGLKVEDAAKMAEVLGFPFSSLALEVETKLRLGWSEEIGEAQLALTASKEVNIRKTTARIVKDEEQEAETKKQPAQLGYSPENESQKKTTSIPQDTCHTESTNLVLPESGQ